MKSTLTVSSWQSLLLSSSSIFLGAFFFTTLLSGLFSIQESVEENAAEILGGDIKVSTSTPFTEEQKEAIILSASESKAVTFQDRFTAMVITDDTEKLTSVSVIDDAYPLYGMVTMTSGTFRLPTDSEVLLEAPFQTDLGVRVNDEVQIGQGKYQVIGFFSATPDNQSAFSFFGTRAIMSPSGLTRSGVMLSQNRSTHIALIRVPENATLISDSLRAIFPTRMVRITDVSDGSGTIGVIFDEVKKISVVFIALITLLFATSFFMGVYFYIQGQTRTIAIIKSLGMPLAEILKKYVLSVGIIWASIGLLGVLIGTGIIYLAEPWLSEKLGQPLMVSPRAFFTSVVLSLTLPFVALLLLVKNIFSLSPSILLKGSDENTSPKPLKQLVQTRSFWKEFLLWVGLVAPFFGLLAYIAESWIFPVFFFTGILVLLLCLSFLLWGIFQGLKKIKTRLPFAPKLLLSFVTEPGRTKFFVLGGFFTLFLIIGTTGVLQKSFLANLNTLSGDDAPSAFFLDITRDQVVPFTEKLSSNGDVSVFPIIRSRIESMGGKTLTEEDSGEIRRPFNINLADQFSASQTITKGQSWAKGTEENLVSVEADFAERQGLKVGDEIVFDVLGRSIGFTVTSIRTLAQRDFNPWFIFTFPANALENAPKSYLGFWWASEESLIVAQKSELIRTFPNISAIETSSVRETVSDIAQTIYLGIFGISLLLILSGSITLFAFLTEIKSMRRKPKKMLGQIGVDKPFLGRLFLGEHFLLLFLPFIFSVFLAVGIVWLLSVFIFDFSQVTPSWLPFIFFGGMLMGLLVQHVFTHFRTR